MAMTSQSTVGLTLSAFVVVTLGCPRAAHAAPRTDGCSLLASSQLEQPQGPSFDTPRESRAPLAQPLNAKTGLWEVTETIVWIGLPPQMAAMMKGMPQTRTYKTCVKTENLSTNPWAGGSGDKCSWTVVTSTSTDMEVRGTACDLGKNYGMKADVHGTIHVADSQHGTGSMDVTLTGSGQTMHGTASYTGKWIGSSCAGMQ
jgi:hypothetical protein